MKTSFISIEIAIKTDGECDAFVDWFSARDNFVVKMPCESHRWYVFFAPLPSSTAELTIRDICEGIPNWPEEVRLQWDEATFRMFDVGYRIGTDPVAFEDHFSPSTLELAAQFGAGITLALYPPSMGADAET